MKIGILTYHRSQNYGALLQARALQEYIKSLGHNVSFVDYRPQYIVDMYKPFAWSAFKKKSLVRKVWYIISFLLKYRRIAKRRKSTNNYINTFLSVTDSCRFDAVIYGSDQIWRKQHKPAFDYFDPVFWGEGLVKTKVKIAYAASMGNIEIDTPEDKIFIKHHLGNFHDVSIREKDLLDRLEEELGTRYKHVCDPVFLLTKEQWNTHIDKKYIPTYKYILYYRLQPIVETDKMVDELTKKTGMQIIEMRGYIPFFHYGCCYRLTADAQEFLSLISGAEFVVSTSFHGIALSLIFQKQFFTTFNLKCAGRIKSILKLLELEHHFMNYNDIVENGLNNPINYELVNVKLQPFVDFSRKWLHDQLKVANIEKGLPKD